MDYTDLGAPEAWWGWILLFHCSAVYITHYLSKKFPRVIFAALGILCFVLATLHVIQFPSSWFPGVKYASVGIGILIIWVAHEIELKGNKSYRLLTHFLIMAVLFVNVVEAAITDFQRSSDNPGYILNGVSGLILTIGIIPATMTLDAGWQKSESGTILYTNLGIYWAVAYFFWHVQFIYGYKLYDVEEFQGGVYLLNFVYNGFVTIMEAFSPGSWLHVRAATLPLFFAAMALPRNYPGVFGFSLRLTIEFYDEKLHTMFSIMTLVIVVVFVAIRVLQGFQKQEIFGFMQRFNKQYTLVADQTTKEPNKRASSILKDL